MQDTLLKQLIMPFWSICSFKKGPQDLPVSALLMGILLVTGMLLDIVYLQVSIKQAPFSSLLLLNVVNTVVMLSIIIGFMWLLGYQQRIIQTITAMQGAGIILTLCALPFSIIVRLSESPAPLFSIFILAIILWSLAVTAHIRRHAISVSLLMGWLLSFGFYVLNFKIGQYFLPQV